MRSKAGLVLSIAVATSALLCSQTTRALNTSQRNGNVNSATARLMASRMVPAQAVLSQEIDARKIHPGQEFRAQLTDTVYLKNGVALPKGTSLIGTVATDKMKPGGTSTLALRFTTADMKNGKAVPIVATIVGISPPEDAFAGDYSDGQTSPDPWDRSELKIDQIGAISGFDLHSSIAGQNSGVFVSTKKDEVRLADQSQLSLAIAARKGNGSNGGA